MNKVLVLTFVTEDLKNYRFAIKNPKDDLNIDTVREVANKIITTKSFNTSKREIKEFKKASYFTRQETVIE